VLQLRVDGPLARIFTTGIDGPRLTAGSGSAARVVASERRVSALVVGRDQFSGDEPDDTHRSGRFSRRFCVRSAPEQTGNFSGRGTFLGNGCR